jgi:hypothetical protein
MEFRRQASSQRQRMRVLVATAAVVLFSVAGWLWVRTRPSAQTPDIAVLDLRERSVARGQNPTNTDQPPLQVPRTAKHLIVDLPIGSNEGSYDLAIFSETGDEILRATGTAELRNHVITLRADFDASSVRAGSYFVGLRQTGLEWTRYPIRVF